MLNAVRNPDEIALFGLASFRFARHYLRNLFDFSSSPYLDVSVQAVPLITLWIHVMIHGHNTMWIAPFGNLRVKARLQLTAAYRS